MSKKPGRKPAARTKVVRPKARGGKGGDRPGHRKASSRNLSKKQRRLEELRKRELRRKLWISSAVLALVALGALVAYGLTHEPPLKPLTEICYDGHESIRYHYHVQLTIIIDGEQQPIPADIGISESCMRPVHTHDEPGKIHIETEERRDATLGDFFQIWGRTFNSQQIFDSVVDEDDTLNMTVDGEPSNKYEKLVLYDDMEIVIEYKTQDT